MALAIAPFAPLAAAAQTPAPAAPLAAAPSDDTLGAIVVTGSRLTSGFTAPTPVTVVSAEQLATAAPNNVADALNQLPSFTNSAQAQNTITGINGANGQSILNLRGLGGARALVLLDGRRLPATNGLGSVDTNLMPQTLIKRVDVVTGGASAAYGSDAVAGVINFVLDTKFEGVKGVVQGGISSREDLPNQQVQLAIGHSFMGGRARIVASGEYFQQRGIKVGKKTDREWFDKPFGQFPNPLGGVFTVLVEPDIRSSVGTPGGLISGGPLKGTQFLEGGATAPFNYGAITGNLFQSGGDGGSLAYAFSPDQKRAITFAHGEYDINPSMTFYAEGHYSYVEIASKNLTVGQVSSDQFTIFNDNAYLPAAVKARMATAGVTSIPVGRFETDFPPTLQTGGLNLYRGVAGLKGTIGGSKWQYDASYVYGKSVQDIIFKHQTGNRAIYAAADAVVNPANGQIVCRSTLIGLDPGCVPLNIFGVGAPSQAAIAYVSRDTWQKTAITQQVAQFNLTGDLGDQIQLGAGPIAVATGFEFRWEAANQTADPAGKGSTDETGVRGAPASYQGKPAVFRYFSPLPFTGSYNVKEAFAEVGVPILKDQPLVKSLSVDGAIRYTDYSQSGGVTTWKVGADYEVNDFRFQYTRSRDIRAPNMLELFNPGALLDTNLVYQGRTTPAIFITTGTPSISPERATTWTSGVTFRPSWFRGFGASVNYFDIKITDAIGTNSAQNTLDQCALGNQSLCKNFTLTSANTLIVYTPSLNLSIASRAGVDYELDYARPLWNGVMSLRALATMQTRDFTQTPGSAPRKGLGGTGSPMWRGQIQARFRTDRYSLFVQERIIGAARIDPTRQEGVYTNKNHVPAVLYTDVTGTISMDGGKGRREAFLTINNLLDRDPPVAPANPTNFSYPSAAPYDRIGRYFTFGVRFQLD